MKNILHKQINIDKINLRNTLKITLKVIFGFGIIAVLFFFTKSIIHKKLSKLSETVSSIIEPNIKLIKLKEISSCIYDAEANAKAYTVNRDTAFLLYYDYYINYLNTQLDTLQWLSVEGKIVDKNQAEANHIFSTQLNKLRKLIKDRVDLFNEYIDLKTGKNSRDVIIHLLHKIKLKNPVVKNNTEQKIETPKKSFFSQLFSSKKDIGDKSNYVLPSVLSDSIQRNILKIITQVQQEEKINESLQSSEEIDIAQREYVVMHHIFFLLKSMEEKELTEGIKRINIATKETTAQISLISNWLTIFGLILVLMFSYFIYIDIRRAKRFKEQLLLAKRNAEKLTSQYSRSLIEASLDPLVTISSEGKITDLNEAKVNITGVLRKELIDSDFINYFTEPEKAREVYKEVFKKGSISDSPLTFKHKNGKLTDVLFNGSVYKDFKGNVLGAVVVARDISEQKWAIELRNANKELAFQNNEKEKRAAELVIANKELAFQNNEKEKRAAELVIANKELAFQNNEKEKRAAELVVANKELAFQNDEKEKRAAELVIANKELAFQNEVKEKRAAELVIANKELAFQNEVKEKRAAELVIANEELAFQNDEKEKRAAELVIANEELAFQNNEKEKRADELLIANKELVFQNNEKEKRAAELVIADIELDFQNKEKEKREIANKELEVLSNSAKLASQYSLSLIEASLDPLVTINTEGKITDMNHALANITGMTREKLTGTDFFDYFTEPQKAREVYQEVFAKGSVADSPLTLRHKDGKLTDVLFNGSVYKDDKGNVLGVVIVARDVTAQKLLSKYSLSLIEASLDPLFTISTEGKITDMNEATVNITGIKREKLIGSDFFDYFTEQQKAREVYQDVFAKGSIADSPLTLRHKDNKLTDVLFNGSVYKDDRGNVLGAVVVARDITEQKQIAEREIAGREKELMRIEELERFRKLTVGRELKMIELKKEIEELKSKP